MRMWWMVAAGLVVGGAGCRQEGRPGRGEAVARGVAPATRPGVEDGAVVTRVYDLVGLAGAEAEAEVVDGAASVIGEVRVPEECECHGGMLGEERELANLVEGVREVVSRWSGGAMDDGAVTVEGTKVTVTARGAVQEDVGRMLSAVRAARSIVVDVGVRVVTVPAEWAGTDGLLKGVGEEGKVVDERAAGELMARVGRVRGGSVVAVPAVTVMNGRRGVSEAVTETAYVASLAEEPDGNGMQPLVGKVGTGVAVTVRPEVKGGEVRLMIEPRVARLVGMKAEEWPGKEGYSYQVPVTENWRVRRVISVGDSGWVVVGMGEGEGWPRGEKGVASGRRVFVVARVGVRGGVKT